MSEDIEQLIVNSFKKLGLTEYESKTLMALLRKGTATPLEITKMSGVPQPKVYTSLNSLAEKGLVEMLSERPKKCKPLNIKEAIKKLFEDKINELGESARKIMENIGNVILEGEEFKHEIYNLIGETEIKRKLVDILSMAKWRVLLASPDFKAFRFKMAKDTLIKLAEKGVNVKILTKPDSKIKETFEAPDSLEIRFIDDMEKQQIVLVDERIYATISIVETGIGPQVWFSTFTTCKACINEFKEKFRAAWSKSSRFMSFKPVEKIKVSAVVLAAGEKSFEGGNILLYEWKGKPIICHVIEALEFSNLDKIIVVLGYDADKIYEAIKEIYGNVDFVFNREYGKGMLSSFKKGLIEVKESDAVFLVLGDQPFIESSLINEMIKRYLEKREEKRVYSPVFSGRRGHPVLFSSMVFDELLGLRDGESIKKIVDKHKESTLFIEGAKWVLMDVNAIKDLETAEKMFLH